MDNGTELQAKGKIERGKGKARQTYGKLTGDKSQQARGAAENAVGRVKDAAGSAIHKVTKNRKQQAAR